MATSMYNHHRFARAIMKKFRKAPASMTIELHSNHWLFKGQQGRLEYDGTMRPFLAALREQSIPAFLLNTILNSSTYIPIYDGCLLVEIHDYRTSCLTAAQELANQASGSDVYQRNPFHSAKPFNSSSSTRYSSSLNSRPAPTSTMGMSGLPCSVATINRTGPQTNGLNALHAGLQESSEEDSCTKYRVVMKPDSVSMWEQLVHLNQVHGSEGEWDDQSVLQMESRILAAIAPPLALDTSFVISRAANLAIAVTAPTLPFMSWDGRYIPRAERHQVQDRSINAKQLHQDPDVTGESSARKSWGTSERHSENGKGSKRGRGDAAKLGYEQQEIDLFSKVGPPSVDDLSDKAKAARDEKSSSPMSVWNWLSRTYGYHKLRRPGQEPPSNTIFTGQNTRGGAVNGDAAAAMMAIANERANGQAEEAAAAAAAAKKKPTKKRKKEGGPEESTRGGSVIDVKPEESKEVPEASKSRPKPKKKKDIPPPALPTVAPKGKKRAADEMSEAGSVTTIAPPPPSPSQPPKSAVSVDSKKSILPPPPPTGKKLTKKQQRAFDAAERERARQEAAAAAAAAALEQQPPKKKAKKNTTNVPSTAPSTAASLATPSVYPIGLADLPAPDLTGNYEQPVDLSGEDFSQMVPSNLLDPALPLDLANMPIGEVPENIFLAAAADVDFNFPFPSGGPDGGVDMDVSGLDFSGMGQSQDDMSMALAMLQQGQMPDLTSRQPEQSRGPPGS